MDRSAAGQGPRQRLFCRPFAPWRFRTLSETTRPTMAKTGPVPQPGILEINAYVPGESNVPGGVTPIKLSSNETPLGPSPKAIAAYKAVADELAPLPGRGGDRAARAIARQYGLNPDRIVVRLRLRRADQPDRARLRRPGRRGDLHRARLPHVQDRHAVERRQAGAVPEKAYRADVDAILARVTPRTKVVFLANPNNPTGTYIPHDEVRRLHKGLPGQHAAGARRRLLRVRAAQRLRGRAGAGRHHRQHGDDAHLLQDLRAGGAAARLGLLPGADRRRAQPRARAVQRHRAGARRRRGGAGGPRARRVRRRAQRHVAALGHGRDREAGAQGDAERRQLRADPLRRRRRARTRPRPTSS